MDIDLGNTVATGSSVPLSGEQIALVQSSFARLERLDGLLADLFYFRLFALDPALRQLFADDMRRQKHALTAMLHLMVADLSDHAELVTLTRQLGERHLAYGVLPTDYPTVGAALTWALEQALDPDFTPETRAAWLAAYTMFATIMLEARS